MRPATTSSRPSAIIRCDRVRDLRRDAVAVNVPPRPRVAHEAALVGRAQALPQRMAVRPQAVDRRAPADLAPIAAAASATARANSRPEPRPGSTGAGLEIGMRARDLPAARQRDDPPLVTLRHQATARGRPWSGRYRSAAPSRRLRRDRGPRPGLEPAHGLSMNAIAGAGEDARAAPVPGCRSPVPALGREQLARRRVRLSIRRSRARPDRRRLRSISACPTSTACSRISPHITPVKAALCKTAPVAAFGFEHFGRNASGSSAQALILSARTLSRCAGSVVE